MTARSKYLGGSAETMMTSVTLPFSSMLRRATTLALLDAVLDRRLRKFRIVAAEPLDAAPDRRLRRRRRRRRRRDHGAGGGGAGACVTG